MEHDDGARGREKGVKEKMVMAAREVFLLGFLFSLYVLFLALSSFSSSSSSSSFSFLPRRFLFRFLPPPLVKKGGRPMSNGESGLMNVQRTFVFLVLFLFVFFLKILLLFFLLVLLTSSERDSVPSPIPPRRDGRRASFVFVFFSSKTGKKTAAVSAFLLLWGFSLWNGGRYSTILDGDVGTAYHRKTT